MCINVFLITKIIDIRDKAARDVRKKRRADTASGFFIT